MKGFLFLCVVGVGLYAALVITHDRISSDAVSQNPNSATVRHLRSWGSDLPALAGNQRLSQPHLNAVEVPRSDESDRSRALETASGVSREYPSSPTGTPYEPIEWAKVIFAARMHSEASVSSPTARFYQPGTVLQVVSREDGFVEVVDPTSRESGWVFEKYLGAADSPNVTQTAMQATTGNGLAEPKPTKKTLIAKKRSRASKPAVQAPDRLTFAQYNAPHDTWNRRAERRGRGFFFFRRFAGTEQ